MKNNPSKVQLTSLNPPSVARSFIQGLIVRQRLFDLLEQGRSKSCVWVTAAAGYGKTSLLASYLDQRQEPNLWYVLQPADADLIRFFQHLAQTLKRQSPALNLPEISLINLVDPQAFGEAFFTALNEIPLTLVLDDYHHLSADSLVHSAIIPGLERMQAGRWLIASRAPPPPALTRLVANGVIELMATDALRFTLEETRHLLSQRNPKKISGDNAKALYSLSEGWAAGLILLIKQQQLGHLPQATDGLVSGYFKHEILSQFDTETRRFLMICALIPDITASQAAALTGQSDAGQKLESIVSQCAFIKCLPTSPPNYRFHALFCDVLLEISPDELGVETLDGLKQLAGQLLIVRGKLDVAVELLLDIKDWNSLITLIEAQAEILLAQGRVHTLKTWIKSIPEEVAADVIWLTFWDARCDLPFTPAKARLHLTDVLNRFKQAHDCTGVYLTWSYIVESYFIERNETQPLENWLDAFEKLRQDYPLPDTLSVRARVIYARFIIVALRTNSIDRKIDDEMIGLLRSQLPADQKVAYGAKIIFRISLLNEGYERCNEVRAIIQQLLTTEEVSPMDHFIWCISQIIYDYLFAEHPPSLSKSLIEARDISARYGFEMLQHTYQLVVTQTFCIEGRGSEAEQALNPLTTEFNTENLINYGHFKLVAAHCHLVNGQLDKAMDCSEQSLQASQHVNPNACVQSWLAIAQIALSQGKGQKALISLAHVRQICRKIGNQNLEFSARILLATYAMKTKRLQRCQNILRLAFELGNAQRYRRYFMQTPENLASLCAIALNAEINPDYAKALIQANQLTAPTDLCCELWPWPVRILALGPLKVEIHGKPLVFQGKAQVKPMAMLKALISNAGLPVRTEQVAVTLWPDADEHKAKVNTKSTLHRLRKLLGHNVVELREGYLHLNPDCCWLDIIAFRRLMDKTHGKTKTLAELEDCLRLYRGSLLQEDQLPDSAIYLRLELSTFFLDGVQHLAQHLITEDKTDQAITWLLRGLGIEPLSEQLAQELIKLYLQLNRKTDALSFYHSFRDCLIKELAIEPGDELKAIITLVQKS